MIYATMILMLVIGILIVLVVAYGFLVERFWLKVRRVELGLPFRIVVASDWHLGLWKGRRFLRRSLEVIEKEKADLVLMPGDFVYHMRRGQAEKGDLRRHHRSSLVTVSDHTPPTVASRFLASHPFSACPEGLGVFEGFSQMGVPMFGVLGNHDLMEFSKEEMAGALGKVSLVDNVCEVVEVGGEKVAICGVGDLMMKDDHYEGVLAALELRRRGKVERVLVLMHNPDGVRKMVLECGVEVAELVDLVVCGHTHGGQLRMPRILRRFAVPCEEDFVSGIYEVCGVRVLVSAGLGETLLPVRLGVRPEVVVGGRISKMDGVSGRLDRM